MSAEAGVVRRPEAGLALAALVIALGIAVGLGVTSSFRVLGVALILMAAFPPSRDRRDALP
jgi:hypothetical protein